MQEKDSITFYMQSLACNKKLPGVPEIEPNDWKSGEKNPVARNKHIGDTDTGLTRYKF